MSIPQITIQGWHHDGPVYRIHRPKTGWRNRKARRAGEDDFDQVGHPGGRNVEEPSVFMVYAHGAEEVYALNRGHAYEIEQILDGDVGRILVDAREDYLLHSFKDGLEFLGARPLTDAELEQIEAGTYELEQPTNISDGAESQEPIEVVENNGDLLNHGEQRAVEPEQLQTPAVPEDVQNVSPSGAIGVVDLGGDVPPTPDPLAQAVAAPVADPEQAELTDAQADELDTALDEQAENARDEKYTEAQENAALADDLGVTVEELLSLTDEERAELMGEGDEEE